MGLPVRSNFQRQLDLMNGTAMPKNVVDSELGCGGIRMSRFWMGDHADGELAPDSICARNLAVLFHHEANIQRVMRASLI